MGLAALSPFFLARSTTYFSHALALVLTLILLLALRARETGRSRAGAAAVASAAAGCAIHVSPFVAVPLLAVAAERWLASRRARPASAREVAAFVVPVALGAILFGAVNAATTGSAFAPAYFLRGYVRAGFGEEVGLHGYTPADAVRGTWLRIAALDRFLFGWSVSSFLFAAPYALLAGVRRLVAKRRAASRAGSEGMSPLEGGGPAARRDDRWDRALTVLFLATVGIYAFWYHPGTEEDVGPRFLYPALPTLVIFSPRGIDSLPRALGRLARGRRVRAALAGSVLLLLGALTLLGTVPCVSALAETPRARERRGVRALLEEMRRRGIDDGTVFVTSPSTAHGPGLLFASRFDDSRPLVFARDLGPMRNRGLVVRRGGGPLFTARFDPLSGGWVLLEGPPRRVGVSPMDRRHTACDLDPPGASGLGRTPRPRSRHGVRSGGWQTGGSRAEAAGGRILHGLGTIRGETQHGGVT